MSIFIYITYIYKMELKPILKWAGGKTQIIDELLDKFPKNINIYYEPFIGGGSVFLKILEKCEKKEMTVNNFFLNDKNQNLIILYNIIKNNIKELLKELEILKNNYLEAEVIDYEPRHKCKFNENEIFENIKDKGKLYIYYFYRHVYNTYNITDCKKAALFLFLNKTCFRGLYREGNNKFNVSFGHYKNPNIYDKNYLIKLNKLFNKYNLIFNSISFDKINYQYDKNNFIYFDPPYYPINDTSFVDYQKSGFKEEENKSLLELCNKFNNNKCKFVHSNSHCVYNLINYNNYKINKILCKRRINSKNPKAEELELIIYN